MFTLPRKIIIAGKPVKLKYDRNLVDAEYDQIHGIITIGTKSKVAEERLDSFLHEVIETICHIRKTCYERPYMDSSPDSDDYLFVLTHDDLCVFVADLVPIIMKLIT